MSLLLDVPQPFPLLRTQQKNTEADVNFQGLMIVEVGQYRGHSG